MLNRFHKTANNRARKRTEALRENDECASDSTSLAPQDRTYAIYKSKIVRND
jgi:hypothetical protein